MAITLSWQVAQKHEWLRAEYNGWVCDVNTSVGRGHVRLQAPPTAFRSLWWIDYAADGTEIARGSGWLGTPSDADAANATACISEIIAAIAPLKLDETDPIYIRYTRLPKGGRSRNHATGELEAGVSCYNARRTLDGGYVLAGGGLSDAAISYTLAGAVVLLLSGEHVGSGSDGEPVLRSPKVLAELTWDGDGGCYRSK